MFAWPTTLRQQRSVSRRPLLRQALRFAGNTPHPAADAGANERWRATLSLFGANKKQHLGCGRLGSSLGARINKHTFVHLPNLSAALWSTGSPVEADRI